MTNNNNNDANRQESDPFRAALRRARVVPLQDRERRFLESIECNSTVKVTFEDPREHAKEQTQ